MKIKSIVIHEIEKKTNSTGAVAYIGRGAGVRMALLRGVGSFFPGLYKIKNSIIKKLVLPVIIMFFAVISTAINADSKIQKNINATPLISILDSPGFTSFKLTLSHIVKERNPDVNWPQHFYVAKYAKDKELIYMFWQEMKLLWIMSPGGLDEESWLGIRYPGSGQLIDLQKNVVSTADKVGSSSYLVTKDWAANRLFDAVIKGDLIIINE